VGEEGGRRGGKARVGVWGGGRGGRDREGVEMEGRDIVLNVEWVEEGRVGGGGLNMKQESGIDPGGGQTFGHDGGGRGMREGGGG